MNSKLYIKPDKPVLEFGGQTAEIALSVAQLEAQFTPYPPSETAWEAAIMQVEDAVLPYRDVLADYRVLELHNAIPLQPLGDKDGQIAAATFEQAFAVLAGYRLGRDLPGLAHNPTVAALVLLMREWMHHLDFDAAKLAS